jgi:uncharacterized protein
VTAALTPTIAHRTADELGVRERQVSAAVDLLDRGATVPFVTRYRKEATGGLDDAQLRNLDDRLRCPRELEERRTAIIEAVRAQVLDVEVARKRISLTLRLDDTASRPRAPERPGRAARPDGPARPGPQAPLPGGAMAAALRRAGQV